MAATIEQGWQKVNLSEAEIGPIASAERVTFPTKIDELVAMACGTADADRFDVNYTLPDGTVVNEAEVIRLRNGVAVNYPEPYMRRRDPKTMVIADDKPTDKPRYEDRFGEPFAKTRAETLEWMAEQELVVTAFYAGGKDLGLPAVAIIPRNAAFFAHALGELQGFVPLDELPDDFSPRAVIYVAPPFRHTHFDGKQVVVHSRGESIHELFSYNLYPGPSAKKGVYAILLDAGESEGWVTAHCSTVRVVTPYDNEIVIMHEGASGGGKSEMLEYPHRTEDGRLRLGKNLVTGEERFIVIPRGCRLEPVVDDMAQCHRSLQDDSGRLTVADAEAAWFVRVNHITEYGTDLNLERLTATPPRPLTFLNIDAVPGGRAMIWEHVEDSPGIPCPNPRVILPRSIVPGIVNEPVKVDVRTFGVRTPPCTREAPTYGIMGLCHILPPALAWLWRLVAPRGHGNPSILSEEGLKSEGVGSYWPFATGRKVDQANLLLKQFIDSPRTRYALIPNQHVGAWKVDFMPNWLTREYIARRGMARFKPEHLTPARCPLLGYALYSMQIEGSEVSHWFLEVNTQPEVGKWGYDRGAEILTDFFHKELRGYLEEGLDPLGAEIINACLDGATIEHYNNLMESAIF